MKDIDPVELSRQLKKPSGELGHQVAQKLNESNQKLYELAWEMTDFSSIRRILEVGFGNGKHLSYYVDQNPDLIVTGVDFSEEMCDEARTFHHELIKNGKLTIHCVDSSSIPAADHSYDLVIGLNIVYFWDPPDPYLEEIVRVLKPGGKLVLGYRPRQAVEHLEFTKQNFLLYEPDELDALLSEYGLKVTRHQRNTYTKQAADESSVEITDICIVAEQP